MDIGEFTGQQARDRYLDAYRAAMALCPPPDEEAG